VGKLALLVFAENVGKGCEGEHWKLETEIRGEERGEERNPGLSVDADAFPFPRGPPSSNDTGGREITMTYTSRTISGSMS
jgi:hypothetical protein